MTQLRRIKLDGMGGWLLLAAFALLVTWTTFGNRWPASSSLRFWWVWLLLSAVAIGIAAVVVARLRPSSPRLRPLEALAISVAVLVVMVDVTGRGQFLRDFAIYLKAGHHWLDGQPVYMQAHMTSQPVDRSEYPFLYPPLTLPLFGLLALLPVWLAQALWVALSGGCAIAALRLFGLPWRWTVLGLLWPPMLAGIWVGNVAVPALLLFALGPWVGAALVVGGAFKSYTGLAALWLVRERRWRAIAAGIAALVVLAAVTVPLTGIGAWQDWVNGLRLYQESQPLVPALYGFGLGKYVPFIVYAALAAMAVVVALLARGRVSLARLGVATIVASPSLFEHGLLVALPAMLSMRAPWMWLAVGLMAIPEGPPWWMGVGVIAASWAIPAMCGEREPWPSAPGDRAETLRDGQVVDRGLAEDVRVAPERPADRLDADRPLA